MLSIMIAAVTMALLELANRRFTKRSELGLAEWAAREAELKARRAEIDALRSAALRTIDEAADRAIIEIRREQAVR